MLKKARPEVLLASLTLKGQGETVKFDVTYFNRKQSELDAKLAEGKDMEECLLFLVKDWDSEYELSTAGIKELEDDRPGAVTAVIYGFHEARRVAKEKN